MTLRIISAEKIEFEGEVSIVTLPGSLGSFQILPGHADLISSLSAGTMSYTAVGGTPVSLDIHGGVADVKKDTVNVCLY